MNPADETAGRIEPSAGAVAGSNGKLDEQLRVSVEALLHPSPPPKPVEEVDDLLLAISRHLNDEASERKAIHYRLLAIEKEMKRPASRGFAGYLLAICIGVLAAFAWQSYAEPAKQIIATSAPKLGWSPEAKQMITSWVERLGWTKQPVGPESTADRPPVQQSVASMPAASFPDLQQMQQIGADITAVRQAVERHLADVRETVEQLAAGQDQMARQLTRLENADVEILAKLPASPPQPPVPPARKPIARPPSRAPIAPHLSPHP